MDSFAFDDDDAVVLILAIVAVITLVASVRMFRTRPRRTGPAAALLILALVLGYASYFWATFQIRLF